MNAVATVGVGKTLLLHPANLTELNTVAQLIARSDLAPKDYRGKPENCAIAIAMGAELGVSPMQAIQGIAVINGRPAVWGDLMMALCRAHPQCEMVDEQLEFDDAGNVTAAVCVARRTGQQPQQRRFSVEDAKRAKLWGKEGPWSQYPQRMLQMRARSWALRDLFADALRGLASAEEQDDVVVEIRQDRPLPARQPAQIEARQEPQPYAQAEFDKNADKWRGLIERGQRTPDEIIATVSSKGVLSEQQQQAIRAMAPVEQEAAA